MMVSISVHDLLKHYFSFIPFLDLCFNFINFKVFSNLPCDLFFTYSLFKSILLDFQDGGGVRSGDQLPPHKYIRNTSTCGTTPTEHLLNGGRRPETSQKARNSPCTCVEQKKKEKNRDKRKGTGPAPPGGSCEGGKVSTH